METPRGSISSPRFNNKIDGKTMEEFSGREFQGVYTNFQKPLIHVKEGNRVLPHPSSYTMTFGPRELHEERARIRDNST